MASSQALCSFSTRLGASQSRPGTAETMLPLEPSYQGVPNTHVIMPTALVRKKTLGHKVGYGVILSPGRKQSHRPCPLHCGNEASRRRRSKERPVKIAGHDANDQKA